MSVEHAIEVESLGRRFGDFVAVRDVSFHVEKGEIFAYLGANGAGKSTTIRMLSGLLAPSSGRAVVAGHDITTAPERVKASIGYMSQKFSLYLDLSVRENLEFFGGIYGRGDARCAVASRRRSSPSACGTSQTPRPPPCAAACDSASRSAPRSCTGPRSSSSTSPPRASIPRRVATSGS
jgi:ABC-type sugar transport system ATPase subunit